MIQDYYSSSYHSDSENTYQNKSRYNNSYNSSYNKGYYNSNRKKFNSNYNNRNNEIGTYTPNRNPNYNGNRPSYNPNGFKNNNFKPKQKPNLSKNQPKKKPPKPEPPFKYTVNDIEALRDEVSGEMPKKVILYLKRVKPKVVTPSEKNVRLIKNWKDVWKKKPHLTDLDYKNLVIISNARKEKLKKHREINQMVYDANIHGAEHPHSHFARLIAKVGGVRIEKIEVEANSDTSVFFRYKGNHVVAVCYGLPLDDKKRFLPTKLIVNDKEEIDCTRLNIGSCIRKIPAKKVVICRIKKPTVTLSEQSKE